MNPLFAGLFDDDALFPPASVPLPAAVGAHVSRAASGLAPLLAEAVRHHFVSFGTCSIDEPVDGLLRYGLLSEDSR